MSLVNSTAAIVAPQPILFVDDEPEILRALSRTVAQLGWAHDTCESPVEALTMLSQRDYAVVVADLRMPAMDGVEFLSRAKDACPTAERILLTAYAETEALERGINEAGISRFLRKPWRKQVLVAILEQAMAQNRLAREHSVLNQRVQSRNEELEYLNLLLRDSVAQSAQTLVRFRRRWDAALNAISDPIVIISRNLTIEGANDAANALAGRSFDETEGRPCYEALFGNSRQCAACPIESGSGRLTRTTDGAELFFDARAYPLPGHEPSHLCVYTDVTQAIAYRAQAAHLEKMAAIGRLAGGVAHELNNPLHGVLSFVQLADKPDVAPEKLHRYHEIIRECALRCRDIVQSMRTFSRRADIGERKPVDPETVCHKAMLLFEHVHETQLDTSQLPQGVQVLGNANQLQQVLVNLIQNALDATPKGSRIKISITVEEDEMVLAVEDEGCGVPTAEREKIFEPFYTTKPEGQGTGLGLAISHSIMREHNGVLRVIDRTDKNGARFEMRLAVLQETAAAAPDPAKQEEAVNDG